MRDEQFEWDDRKAASNVCKHGIAFELARLVFDDVNVIKELDENAEEEKFSLIGMAVGRLLVVVYAHRPPRNRIISARKANIHEQRRYFAAIR